MAAIDKKALTRIAEETLAAANLLLDHGFPSRAWYLAGYSVELGLKACIADQFQAATFPDKRLVGKIFTHDFAELVAAAGLAADLSAWRKGSSIFEFNWIMACAWKPDSRYEEHSREEAAALLEALGDPTNWVMTWIRSVW
jgi:HEPN domain-containing protein